MTQEGAFHSGENGLLCPCLDTRSKPSLADRRREETRRQKRSHLCREGFRRPRRPTGSRRSAGSLREGDTLACYKLDRVGRSLAHLAKILAELDEQGVHFRTVEDGLNTQGSTGKLVLHMLGAVAQFERDLIIERTRAGLASARKNGKRLGPPVKWQADMAKQARKLLNKGDLTAQEVANVLKVSRRTLFRGLKDAREHDELLEA